MHCRDITDREFEAIAAELTGVTCQADDIETVTGRHEHYGSTVLVRDALRCMALLEDASIFDVFRLGGLSAEGRVIAAAGGVAPALKSA